MAVKFEVLAINPKAGNPGLMGHAETREAAEDLRDQATHAGWLLATIVDSPQQFREFGKIADIVKLDFSGLR